MSTAYCRSRCVYLAVIAEDGQGDEVRISLPRCGRAMGGDPLQYPCGGLSDGQDGPARALRAGRCTARKGSSLEVLAGRQCPAYTQGQVALRGAGLGHRDRDLPGTGFPMVFKRVCTQNLHGPAPMRNVGPQPPGGHRLSASARAMRCGPPHRPCGAYRDRCVRSTSRTSARGCPAGSASRCAPSSSSSGGSGDSAGT